MKKLNFNFHNIDTVIGHCHQCEEESILVAIVTDFYRCTNCGEDIEQKVNGVIKYMKVNKDTEIKLRELDDTHG